MAVIALALGIGVNATVFTFVNAVLIRGLPFDDPDRIVVVDSRDAAAAIAASRTSTSQDWRAATRTFATLSALRRHDDERQRRRPPPERFNGPYVSANAFAARSASRRCSAATSCPTTIVRAPPRS